MQRRKFIAGLGSIAAAGAAGIGTGAFSLVNAEREMDVSVTGDSGAFLALAPSDTANGAYAETKSNGEIKLDLADGNSVDGSGVNTDAESRFDAVFKVTNQGSQRVFVSGQFNGLPSGSQNTIDAWLYPSSSTGKTSPPSDRDIKLDGNNNVLRVDSGDTKYIGVAFDTADGTNGNWNQASLDVRAEDRNQGANVVR